MYHAGDIADLVRRQHGAQVPCGSWQSYRRAFGQQIIGTNQRRSPIQIETDKAAGNRIGKIVMAAWTMIDAVFAGARCSALQPDQLRAQSWNIEQLNATGIQQGQQIGIQFALRPGALLEFNSVLGEFGPWPFAGVSDRRSTVATS